MALFRNQKEVVSDKPSTPLSIRPAPTTQTQTESVQSNGHGNPDVLPPEFHQIRGKVQAFLANEGGSVHDLGGSSDVRRFVEPVFVEALLNSGLVINRVQRENMLDHIMADILGYGPIQPLLDRDDLSEVMVNGPNFVFIEEKGKLLLTNIKFDDDAHVIRVIERIVSPLGRRIDESSPMVDGRLPDGSHVNAIIPPLALDGPCITIRKFRKDPFKVEDLIEFGTITPEFAQFLQASVIAKLNIIVSGGTGSGKTTFLNVLSSFIPIDERIVTIEDAAELQLQQTHVIRLEKRPGNAEGKGEVGIRELVVNSLRMRPDRIVVGEVRSGEALDMLQAMNTGHDGSLTTVHSNSPRDTLARIETMVMMAGVELPMKAIRQQVSSAVDLIVHIERMRDGKRRMMKCSEVIGMEGDMVVMQDIFEFKQESIDENGMIIGQVKPTGLRPRVNDKIEVAGIKLPPNIFGISARATQVTRSMYA